MQVWHGYCSILVCDTNGTLNIMITDIYSSCFINANFRIKLNGNGVSVLIGFKRMRSLFKDVYVFYNFIDRALRSDKDSIRTKMRNGYTITLYRK